jgi:hypothetical protein
VIDLRYVVHSAWGTKYQPGWLRGVVAVACLLAAMAFFAFLAAIVPGDVGPIRW